MPYKFKIILGYYAGEITVSFKNDNRPDNWDQIYPKAKYRVMDRLYEIADIYEWKNNFEKSQEYDFLYENPRLEVGNLIIDGEDIKIDFSINTIHDCDW